MRWKAWNEVEDDPKFCQTDWVRNNCLLLSQSPSVKITKTPPHPSPAVCCQQGLEDYLWAQHETTHGGLNLQSWGNISLIWESALRQTPPSSTGASRRPRTLCSKKTSHPCLPSPPSVLPYYPPGGSQDLCQHAIYHCHGSYHEKLILLGHLPSPESNPHGALYMALLTSHWPAQTLLPFLDITKLLISLPLPATKPSLFFPL